MNITTYNNAVLLHNNNHWGCNCRLDLYTWPSGQSVGFKIRGVGFNSQCWSCVDVLGKLCIPHCLGPPSCNGYLVHRSKVRSTVAGCHRHLPCHGKSKWSANYPTKMIRPYNKHLLPLPFDSNTNYYTMTVTLQDTVLQLCNFFLSFTTFINFMSKGLIIVTFNPLRKHLSVFVVRLKPVKPYLHLLH